MWPFILLGLAIFLILIVLSVCIYPYICAVILVALKKIKTPVTIALLMLTTALYFFACTVLEGAFNDWCYSVYAGIALTPITLFVCAGVDNMKNWPENNESIKHNTSTIPLLTSLSSITLMLEGILRMANGSSAHTLLNNGLRSSDEYSFWYYHDDFHYAGILLFLISIVSAFIMIYCSYDSRRTRMRELQDKKEKEARIEGALNEISQSLSKDIESLESLPSDSKFKRELLNNYESFCKSLESALDCSDEKSQVTYKQDYFTEVSASHQAFIITIRNKSYYLYPVGLVVKSSQDNYRYIPFGRKTCSFSTEEITKQTALPSTIKPLRQYWLHTCRDGSPDLRYRYNPKTFVYAYGVIHLDNLKFHLSQVSIANAVAKAYKCLYYSLMQLKQESHSTSKLTSVIQNKPQEESIQHEINEKNNPPTHATKVEIRDERNDRRPQNLEECFYDIIKNRGDKVLQEESLYHILITSYKDVDISDYKDVVDKMSKEYYFYQFTEPKKQNDFALYNISNTFAHKNRLNAQQCLHITQMLVAAIKKLK